jgi:pyruvate/2-oxoglutarate dehydrogenase complex dihydrolipoamide dehydrogenase (E3) component
MARVRSVDTFDVIVIGGGPVGEVAGDRAHRGGLSVALVERRLYGGECSYYACIPSKALLRPIHAVHAARRLQGVTGATIDPAGVLARRDGFIGGLDDAGQVRWAEGAGLTVVRGEGSLTGVREVSVDGRTLTARHAVVLATGSSASVPDIPGLRDAKPWTNIEATTSSTIPERLAILGGGVVACELAQVYQALGSQVTVIERSTRLLGRTEDFAGEAVAKALAEQGVSLRMNVSAASVARPAPGGVVTVTLSDGTTVEADEVLCALGRVPSTAGLGLGSVGVSPDARGFVTVDERMTVTSAGGDAPWLYAVGDVNGIALLTHMGKYQARSCGDLIAARAAGTEPEGPAYVPSAAGLGSPQVVFTDPEIAAVGLTAGEATERGLRVRVVDVQMTSAAGASLQADSYAGQARLVVDEDRSVVVGATFVGQDVADLVHAATVAVVGEVPLERLWHAVPSFPTMSEVWLRLLEAYGL